MRRDLNLDKSKCRRGGVTHSLDGGGGKIEDNPLEQAPDAPVTIRAPPTLCVCTSIQHCGRTAILPTFQIVIFLLADIIIHSVDNKENQIACVM